jgi:hypothetical protein
MGLIDDRVIARGTLSHCALHRHVYVHCGSLAVPLKLRRFMMILLFQSSVSGTSNQHRFAASSTNSRPHMFGITIENIWPA